jgi:hypothetical protein
MGNILGRNGRRRRVLNEDALSASSSHISLHHSEGDEWSTDSAPWYSEAAGIEHHPQITDFLPRRYRTIVLLAVGGIGTTTAAVAFDWFAPSWIGRLGLADVAQLTFGAAEGITAWVNAVLLMCSAVVCLVIHSLRRHRIDDIRGRYRIWLAAAIACVVMSADAVAPLHHLLSVIATHITQRGALRDHAAWWLVLGGLPLGWIAMRALTDAFESRLAASALVTSIGCFALSLSSYLMSWPGQSPAGEMVVTAGGQLFGTWMLLIGVVAYGRFVVLDVQGLVARERRPARRRKVKASEKEGMGTKSALAARGNGSGKSSEGGVAGSTSSIRAFRQNLHASRNSVEDQTSQTRWVDGSEPESDDYADDDGYRGDSKLSKSDRKRLRKLKAQHRAA